MKHASLCSGIGACELAATWMDWENAFSCEIDPFCQHVLKYHYPKSKHYENIFGTDFSEWRSKIDILTAGFPCQPFSCAGARKGAEDDRYLWPEVLRVIGEVRPTWFIGENVAGITSMVLPGDEIEMGSYQDIFGENYQETEMREQFVVERICRDLENIGYSVQPIIIPACAVEAPHRRDRIWFIANANGKRCDNRGNFWQERQFCLDKERYAKKNKSERTKRKYWFSKDCETFTNSTGKGLENRFRFKEWAANEKEDGAGMDCEHKRHGEKWFTPDAESKQGERVQSEQCKTCKQKQKQFRGSDCANNMRDWTRFPTQSPVCRGNDGLPFNVHNLTIPFTKWRTESVKSFGNTMVPQVVYRIFKAIENTCND